MRPILARSLAVLTILAAPTLLAAQSRTEDDAEWLDRCQRNRADWERAHACEVRNVPVRLSGRFISIDGQRNGGIRVFGRNGDSVRVTARVQAQDRTESGAKALLSRIRITADGRSVRSDGPSTEEDDQGWSVGYVVYVPRRFDLDLEAHNGGLSVSGVSGKMDLRTHNGGLAITDVGGDVRAQTRNGSLSVELTGKSWEGTGLDAETRNGSVRLSVPEQYAAQLETGTVNGSIRTDIPVTVQGRISRELSIPLGGGGKTIRVRTTNGSVTIARR